MANEKHDPWALLREARETLHDFAENFDCDGDSHKYNTTCRACDATNQRDRIDAALAKHEDSATPVVESVAPSALPEVESDGFWRDEIYRNSVHRCGVLIRRDGLANWYWSVSRNLDGVNVGKGHTNTLDEAKSAAIAAARGMK